MVDYSRLTVTDVIMHAVSRIPGSHDRATATYSEAALEWDVVDRGFLQQKLRSALGAARPVRELAEDAGPTPHLVRDYFAGSGDLLAASRTIADLVVEHQSWNSSDGLIMVVDAMLPRNESAS